MSATGFPTSPPPSSLQKATHRQTLKTKLAEVAPDLRQAWSCQLVAHLAAFPLLQRAPLVLAYAALPDEPDLSALWGTLAPHQTLALPRITGDTLAFYRVTPKTTFTPGQFPHLQEPPEDPAQRLVLEDLPNGTLLLMPGLGFCPVTGVRLGRGKGYYDRFLSDNNAQRCYRLGVCWQLSLVQGLPGDPWDVPVEGLVTEAGVIPIHPAALG